MKGYKVFDNNWTCRGFQYEVGKTYTLNKDEKLIMCKSGFHFCKKLIDCFNYYNFHHTNKIAEIQYFEKNTIHGKDKSVTSKITIVKEITWFEALEILNAGNWNTGHSNSGDLNTGNCNTGDLNTGNCNTGDLNTGNKNAGNCNTGDLNTGNKNAGNRNTGRSNSGVLNTGNYNTGNGNTGRCNTGNYNTGNGNTGFFNTDEGTIRMFNKDTKLKRRDIDLSFINGLTLTKFITIDKMSEAEKEKNPDYKHIGGYLKVYTYKEMWANWYNEQNKNIVNKKIKALPNFDAKIFEEITGLILEEK